MSDIRPGSVVQFPLDIPQGIFDDPDEYKPHCLGGIVISVFDKNAMVIILSIPLDDFVGKNFKLKDIVFNLSQFQIVPLDEIKVLDQL